MISVALYLIKWPHSDLGLLKRDRKLQQRYDEWVVGIREKHESVGEFRRVHFYRLAQD
jgi:hypothetical protein